MTMNQGILLFYLFFGFLFNTTCTIQCSDTCHPNNKTCTCKCQCPTCPTTTACPTTTQSPPTTPCSCPITVTTEGTSVHTEATSTDCRQCPTFSTSPADPKTTIQNCPNLGNKDALELERTADVSPEIIVGAIVGGTLLGSITYMIIFVVLCRKISSSDGCKESNTTFFDGVRNPSSQYEDNTTSQTSHISSQTSTAYCEIIDGMQKTARITPVQKYEKSSTRDDVYNQLHESDKIDRSDYYDHAGPAPSLSILDDGYGVMSSDIESNGAYSKVDGKKTASNYDITGNEQNDGYFTLEIQTDRN